MLFLRNLRFVRKIQFGFLILGVIAAMIAANSIFQINKMSNSKSAIQTEFINPKEYIDNVYLEFQKIQFIMLKFSIPEFHSDFQDHVTTYNFHKTKIDALLDSLSKANFNQEIEKPLNDIQLIWKEYKNIVADAIISASASQTFDMAAVIATSSGEEVGNRLFRH